MKKNIKTIILCLAIVVTLIPVTYLLSGSSTLAEQNYLSQEQKDKITFEAKHDEEEQKMINQNKDKARPAVDSNLLNNSSNTYKDYGILDIKSNDILLSIPYEIAKQYVFLTIGYTPNNAVAAGYCVDNPENGVILNIYDNSKTGECGKEFYIIPGSGKIDLTKADYKNNKIVFSCKNGKTGTFDTNIIKGKYNIN